MRRFQGGKMQNYNYSFRNKRRVKPRKATNYNIMEVDNFPKSLANKDLLYRYEYLGQYGNVIKIDIFQNSSPTTLLKVTFSNQTEASLAILSLNDFVINGQKLKTKFEGPLQREKLYNRFNLKYKLDDNKINKEHQITAIRIADVHSKIIQKNILRQCMNKRTVFPSSLTIYYKNQFVLESNNSPAIKSETKESNNRSRYDFVINEEKKFESEKETNNTPKFISDFIQRIYELKYEIKNKSNNFDVLLFCESFKNKFLKNLKSEKEENKDEIETGKEWFNFLYNTFSEENKKFYQEVYENDMKGIKNENENGILLGEEGESDSEFVKDFDEISEGLFYHISADDTDYSEN